MKETRQLLSVSSAAKDKRWVTAQRLAFSSGTGRRTSTWVVRKVSPGEDNRRPAEAAAAHDMSAVIGEDTHPLLQRAKR